MRHIRNSKYMLILELANPRDVCHGERLSLRRRLIGAPRRLLREEEGRWRRAEGGGSVRGEVSVRLEGEGWRGHDAGVQAS